MKEIYSESEWRGSPAEAHRIRLRIFDSLPSTNTALKEEARAGEAEGLSIMAKRQTAGRGRRGRSFYSPEGTGLYLSTLLRPRMNAENAVFITQAAAVATARVLEEISGANVGIKWVNDIFINGRKVCGILTESAISADVGQLEYAVLGIGVNLTHPKEGFPYEIKDVAGCVFDHRPISEEEVEAIAQRLLSEIYSVYRTLPERGFMKEYRARSILLGRKITAVAGDISANGIAEAIDDNGNLNLLSENGERYIFSSGEASVKGDFL